MDLLEQLKGRGVDVLHQPASYYVGGMENRCRVAPRNVIVFFMHHPCLRKDTEPNFHHRYQLKVNLGGESVFGVDELRFRMPTDTGMLIFPFQAHYVARGDAPGERHHMTVTFTDGGDGGASLLPLRNRPFRLDRRDRKILGRLAAASQGLPGVSPSEAVALLAVFLSRKLEAASRRPDSGLVLPGNPLFARMFACIRDDFEGCSREKDLAGRLGISVSHLRRLVRENFDGVTLGRMLTILRFGYARELLAYSDRPIRDIARRCGYADPFGFSHSFRRRFGLSPSEFRRTCGDPAAGDRS